MLANRSIALLTLVLLPAVAACSKDDTPTSPSPSPDGAVHYTALGASDAIGGGSSIPCAPFDAGCENGRGYPQVLRRRFQAEGRVVSYSNPSVPGYVLSNAIVDLSRQIGRTDFLGPYMDRYPQFVPATTTHVTIFAGGNDANIIGNAVVQGLGGGDPRGFVDGHVRQWGTDLAEFVSRVRGRNPNARIVLYNMPNLAGAPYLAGRPVSERSIMQRIVTGMADAANALAASGVLVVDLMCEPRTLQPATFSADGFHPSDAGHQLMADLAYPALTIGSQPGPAASCASRTVVPTF